MTSLCVYGGEGGESCVVIFRGNVDILSAGRYLVVGHVEEDDVAQNIKALMALMFILMSEVPL